MYQIAAIFTIAAAAGGIWATVGLLRGKKQAYALAVGMLLVGIGTAGAKMYTSNMLRGSVAPTNIRFNLTIVTLLVFLALRLPGIWQQIALTRPDETGPSDPAASFIMLLGGLVTLTTPIWVGDTHMFNGYNLVHLLDIPLLTGGSALVLAGTIRLIRRGVEARNWGPGIGDWEPGIGRK